MARRRLPFFPAAVVIAVLAVLLVGGMAALIYRLVFCPLPIVDRTFLCDTDGGVELWRGREMVEYTLPSRGGGSIGTPEFAVAGPTFVYWSWSDSAVSAISDRWSKPRWFSIPKDADPMRNAYRLTTDGRHVTIDMRGGSWKVVLLDMQTGKCKTLKDAVQARVDPTGSGRIAVHMSTGDLMLGQLPDTQSWTRFAGFDKDLQDWDFDFSSDTLYYLDSDPTFRVCIRSVSRGSNRTLRLPLLVDGLEVFWQPELGELWVPGCGLFSLPIASVYTPKGRAIGQLASGEFYVSEADDELESLLSRYFKGVRRY